MKAAIILLLLLIVSFVPFDGSDNGGGDPNVPQVYLQEGGYAGLVINTNAPTIDNTDDDDTGGPHPDASKCPCGGSGWIRNGDGHRSACPYHGASGDDESTVEEIESIGMMSPEEESEPIAPELAPDAQQLTVTIPDPFVITPEDVEVLEPEAKVDAVEVEEATADDPVEELIIDQTPVLVPQAQIVYFKMNDCLYCTKFEKEEVPRLESAGYVVSEDEDADVRIVNISLPENQELWKDYTNKLAPHHRGKIPVYYYMTNRENPDEGGKGYYYGYQSAATIKAFLDRH